MAKKLPSSNAERKASPVRNGTVSIWQWCCAPKMRMSSAISSRHFCSSSTKAIFKLVSPQYTFSVSFHRFLSHRQLRTCVSILFFFMRIIVYNVKKINECFHIRSCICGEMVTVHTQCHLLKMSNIIIDD